MKTKLLDKEIINSAEIILNKYNLCDHCFGRIFAKVDTGKTNPQRAEIIKKKLKNNKNIKPSECYLCEGLFSEINFFVELITNYINEYEFDSFLLGCRVDDEIIIKEKEILSQIDIDFSESIKTEINRETGKIMEDQLKKEVDFKNPTIMIILDTQFNSIDLQIKSLYIYGRYNKYSREIPQTRWYCKICNGIGCRKCEFKGQLYETSVEELISDEFLKLTKGSDESLHGCGREDIDVRMLGNGRPFVLEIKNPKVRNINLQKIKESINRKNKRIIQVNNLRESDKEEIIRLKKADFNKLYKVKFNCKTIINNEKLKKAVQTLQGSKISQLTPSRVAHRRANMVREKHIYNCKIDSLDGSIATLTLETESGTYIKELVSGDDNRTKPNISKILGAPCQVIKLDVLEIKGE